jgi:hypothetical protein
VTSFVVDLVLLVVCNLNVIVRSTVLRERDQYVAQKVVPFRLSTLTVDVCMHITRYKINGSTPVNFIQKFVSIMLSVIFTLLLTFYFWHSIYKWDVLILYAGALCLPEGGNLSLKPVREFMFMDDLLLYVNFVC